MELSRRKLVVVVAEASLESALKHDLAAIGVTGLTVHDVRGRGTHGDRPAAWEGDSNIRMEIVCDEAMAERILTRLEAQWLPHYGLIVYATDVQVVRPRKF